MSLQTGALLRYGPVKGEDNAVKIPYPIGASETFRLKSGRFVTNDGSGRAELADDGDTLLLGWMDAGLGDADSSSTEGGDIGMLIPAIGCGVVFRIPINAGTFTAAMRGLTCDLVRATVGGVTLIQGAKLDASGEDNLYIVDGDLENNEWVDVMFNPSKLTGYTGVV